MVHCAQVFSLSSVCGSVKLPNLEGVAIAEAKVRQYLLSFSHPFGRHKAAFFVQFGFSEHTWEQLALALTRHAEEYEVTREEDSPFGMRYTIEGGLESPDGRRPLVRAVWFVERGQQIPKFVTAYPVRRSRT
jgi:hypothetical protein